MPSAQRPTDISVIDALSENPHRFEFFQAVRVLEKYFQMRDASVGKKGKGSAVGELIRFRNSLALSFPPSEIELLRKLVDGAGSVPPGSSGNNESPEITYEITPSFIGLTGPVGAMPRHYTEKLIEREIVYRDRAARAFLDVFSNRMVALFYQAWKKYRLPIQYEQDRHHRFTPLLLALTGCNQAVLRTLLQQGDKDVFDESIAHYAGIARHRPASIENVKRVLADYFGTRIHIEQFIGRWFHIPEVQRTKLSGDYAVLGQTAFCGERVWQRQTRLRILIGPMRRNEFLSFLPYGRAASALARLLALLLGQSYEYEVRLLLCKQDIYTAQLGNSEQPARLGWDTFVQTKPAVNDSDDARYEVEATAA